MKTIYSKLMLIALAVFFTGCSDDDKVSNTNVSAVNALYAPKDNTYIDLDVDGGSALFEWQAAKAEDNGVVLYDVVFDVENGDFSKPLYVMPSDGKGFQTTLNISFVDLSKIAALAGIEADSEGKLKWTVLSSKGLKVQNAAATGIFEVKRPNGIETPAALYITGTGSEGGDNLADALPFKKTGASTYEIYTQLKAGDYKFVSRNSGTPENFSVVDGKLAAGDGAVTYTGDSKVYRIRLDFSNRSISMVEVQKIELWFPPRTEVMFEYTYAGKGIWTANDKKVEFKQETWGRDERYKFQVTIMDGTTQRKEYLGSANKDNNKPDANSAASYWYLTPIGDNSYDFTFKFAAAVDNATVNGKIDLSGSAAAYTHSFTIK
jgi:hypothetical protein